MLIYTKVRNQNIKLIEYLLYLRCILSYFAFVLYRETSDLVFCVADLQLNNQKLQEEVRKLKQAVENMEDTNQKLIEENEDLKAQAKMY